MRLQHLLSAALLQSAVILSCARIASGASAPIGVDPRNFENGLPLPKEGYCDQPRVVVTSDGTWVAVLTTAPGREGAEGQHVVATSSNDQGRTGSAPVNIDPAEKHRKSSYALALIRPDDRIFGRWVTPRVPTAAMAAIPGKDRTPCATLPADGWSSSRGRARKYGGRGRGDTCCDITTTARGPTTPGGMRATAISPG